MFSLHRVATVLFALVSFTSIYIVYTIIYNVFIHPFRSVPGPKLYAISRFPWIKDWLSGNIHVSVQAMHEKYGDMVRVAPDEISCIRAEAWAEVYGHKGSKAFTRDFKWYARLTEGQDDIIVSTEADHSRFRKAFSASFSDKALKENEGIIMRNVALLVSRLQKHVRAGNDVADMIKWYNWCTFDVIGDLVYGSSFACLEKEEYHPWLGVVLQNIKLSSYGALMERYPAFKWLVNVLVPKSMLEMRNMHIGIIRSKIESRSEKQSTRRDVIADVSDTGDLTQGELEANLALITMAGSETSATALSAISYYLCRNESAFVEVKEEVRSTLRSEADITWDRVSELPYLAACIKEALRLYPPTPVGLPRRLMSDGTTVCGQYVPKNNVVYITQYSAYRSELNFLDAKSFRPERWLGDPKFESDQRDVFQPFIVGPYSCPGKSLAYMEISLVITKIVWTFDWALADEGSLAFENEKVYALWQKNPLNLKLSERPVR
ncbi:cytochrome P450 [Decorospora gaudefroyi]|uniref:Cytochrome P450 n=1 Tax=Decorospora gaudefroyi TaxID=184978 RepID=A0A6A5JYC0_9PLEO|nr:cytochrome P450 [Decorospora gaudefroyi]